MNLAAQIRFHRTVALIASVCFASLVSADITAIDEFTGDLSDNFNRFTTTHAEQVLPVFGGNATLSNLTDGGAIKVEFSSTFNGDNVSARSGSMVGQLGIGRWDFSTPSTRFGGLFENNGGADDATVFFYDSNQFLLGSVIAIIPASGGSWTWNGWESSTPFSRVEVVGNGVINGFLWYENMQLTTVPAPASALALLAALLPAGSRRRGPRAR